VVGESVGDSVGDDVVGEAVGEDVGDEVVGEAVGAAVVAPRLKYAYLRGTGGGEGVYCVNLQT
jgi:hypothetical protein